MERDGASEQVPEATPSEDVATDEGATAMDTENTDGGADASEGIAPAEGPQPAPTPLLEERARMLEERARTLAFQEDEELKRGSRLMIIPPASPAREKHQDTRNPAIARHRSAVNSALQAGTSRGVNMIPTLVPTIPGASIYLDAQQTGR